MDYIKNLILKFVARNLDDIISVFTKLDAQLDAYIEKQLALEESLVAQREALNRTLDANAAEIDRAHRVRANIRAITK